jgi:sugar/nucleoside kinase (ribokinase family)
MKIITLGTATLDIILQTHQEIREGSKIEIQNVFFSLGGGALNAATTFKNLNLDYLAHFRLGKDLIGKVILQKIKKEKLKTKIFFHQGDSQFSVVLLLPQKERTIFVYRGLSDHFSFQELNQIQKGDFYYLTTANISPDILEKFLKKIKHSARLISVIPSRKFLVSPKAKNSLSLADILFLNYEEAGDFLKKKLDAKTLGKELYQKLKIKVLVLTLGDKGSLTFFEDKIFSAGIFKPKKFVDPTGAGDAFASAFFANLVLNKEINEETIKKAIVWGSANASANIEKLGAQIGLLKKNDFSKYDIKKISLKIWKN